MEVWDSTRASCQILDVLRHRLLGLPLLLAVVVDERVRQDPVEPGLRGWCRAGTGGTTRRPSRRSPGRGLRRRSGCGSSASRRRRAGRGRGSASRSNRAARSASRSRWRRQHLGVPEVISSAERSVEVGVVCHRLPRYRGVGTVRQREHVGLNATGRVGFPDTRGRATPGWTRRRGRGHLPGRRPERGTLRPSSAAGTTAGSTPSGNSSGVPIGSRSPWITSVGTPAPVGQLVEPGLLGPPRRVKGEGQREASGGAEREGTARRGAGAGRPSADHERCAWGALVDGRTQPDVEGGRSRRDLSARDPPRRSNRATVKPCPGSASASAARSRASIPLPAPWLRTRVAADLRAACTTSRPSP